MEYEIKESAVMIKWTMDWLEVPNIILLKLLRTTISSLFIDRTRLLKHKIINFNGMKCSIRNVNNNTCKVTKF